MADVYYRIDGSNIYFTNQRKSGYSFRSDEAEIAANKYVTVEDTNFILPTNSSYLFKGALNTSFSTSGGSTTGCTKMNYLFRECTHLRDIDISMFNTSLVTEMYGLFMECNSLVTVNVSDLNLSSIITSGSLVVCDKMFYHCYNLEHIYANPGTDGIEQFQNLTTGSALDMYIGCSKLPNFDRTDGKVSTSVYHSNNTIADSGGRVGFFEETPVLGIEREVGIKENGTWKQAEVYL